MKNELLNTVDYAINKNREYNHSTKKNLETKNRKKTVERKTQYNSYPQIDIQISKDDFIRLTAYLENAKLFTSLLKDPNCNIPADKVTEILEKSIDTCSLIITNALS